MVATLIDSDVVGFADGNAGHVYNFPAGAPSVGHLDILCINSDTVVSTPSGFTLRVNATNDQGAYIFSRKAVGGEASSVTITTTGNNNTVLTWSRWSGTDAFSVGGFQRVDNVNGTSLPATSTGALAATGMLVIAFGALHFFDGALATSPVWINSWTPMESGSQGAPGTIAACVAFTAFKTNAGTAAETINSVSWTNNARDRYALYAAFTSTAGDQNLSPGGITSGIAFGTPTITASNTIEPTGIASGEAFGTPTITASNTIEPTGIASSEAFGTPTVTAGPVDISPTGIASGETFGTPTLTPGAVTVAPFGISSGEVFGTPSIASSVDVGPTGIPSAEALGTPVITAGPVDISPTGIASLETFGLPTIAHGSVSQFIEPVGIPSGEAFGTPIAWRHVVRRCDCSLLVGN